MLSLAQFVPPRREFIGIFDVPGHNLYIPWKE
jgi:hypothetical protein